MGRRNEGPSTTEVDMTPMIDIVFQLMTFFIFTLNFSEAEQDDRIQLPLSQLAKPVPGPVEKPITLQVTSTSSVIYAGELMVEIIPKITRPGQMLQILGVDDTPKQVIIGQPHIEGQNGQPPQPVTPEMMEQQRLEKGMVKLKKQYEQEPHRARAPTRAHGHTHPHLPHGIFALHRQCNA